MKRETYRAACDQAKAELKDILAEFDFLRARKDQIERMIAVLEPLSGPEDGVAAHIDRESERRYEAAPVAEVREFSRPRAEESKHEDGPVPVTMAAHENKTAENEWNQSAPAAVDETIAAMEGSESEEVFQPDEVSSDPIKRRIVNALRHRVVLRDNREFNQAFSSGLTRW